MDAQVDRLNRYKYCTLASSSSRNNRNHPTRWDSFDSALGIAQRMYENDRFVNSKMTKQYS